MAATRRVARAASARLPPLAAWLRCLGLLIACGQVACAAPAADPTGGIQLIGAGLQRTGLQSLGAALARLGFSSTGGLEYQLNPEIFRAWNRFLDEGSTFDGLDHMMRVGGWNATLDFPFNVAYQSLMDRYPSAKVVLTVRDSPEAWTKSYVNHIPEYSVVRHYGAYAFLFFAGFWGEEADVSLRLQRAAKFHNCDVFAIQTSPPEQRPALLERCNKGYQAYVDEVVRKVPFDRLLVFNVKDGWKPLCDFLGVPVPQQPFPRVDDAMEQYLTWCYAVLGIIAASCFGMMFLYLRCRRFFKSPWPTSQRWRQDIARKRR